MGILCVTQNWIWILAVFIYFKLVLMALGFLGYTDLYIFMLIHISLVCSALYIISLCYHAKWRTSGFIWLPDLLLLVCFFFFLMSCTLYKAFLNILWVMGHGILFGIHTHFNILLLSHMLCQSASSYQVV